MNVAMRYQGIVSLVATKMGDAKFHAMLSFFMKDATSVEAQRMARLVASTEGDSGEFERQARTAFENLCQKQGGGDVINVEKLKDVAAHVHSVEGTTIEDLVNFFSMFDVNGDGEIDFPAFTRKAIAQGAKHFFVERDNPPAPEQSIERSYAYLNQMTF